MLELYILNGNLNLLNKYQIQILVCPDIRNNFIQDSRTNAGDVFSSICKININGK